MSNGSLGFHATAALQVMGFPLVAFSWFNKADGTIVDAIRLVNCEDWIKAIEVNLLNMIKRWCWLCFIKIKHWHKVLQLLFFLSSWECQHWKKSRFGNVVTEFKVARAPRICRQFDYGGHVSCTVFVHHYTDIWVLLKHAKSQNNNYKILVLWTF